MNHIEHRQLIKIGIFNSNSLMPINISEITNIDLIKNCVALNLAVI